MIYPSMSTPNQTLPSLPPPLKKVWGAVVRDWLEEILPDDAHERCTGRVHISVLCLPYRRHHVRCVCFERSIQGRKGGGVV